MNRRNVLSLSATTALGLALLPGSAISQPKSLKEQLVGTWTLVSFESKDPSGAKVPSFQGADLRGLLIFTDSGRVSFQVMTEIPKLASKERLKTTPEENTAVAHGVLSYFGTYTVDEANKTINLHIERSSFPNQNGVDTKRVITSITADELKFSNLARTAGGTNNFAWKRAK